jgi:hypothetical protein
MLHALCVIALDGLLSGSTVRLCCIFAKLGGSAMIVIWHFLFLQAVRHAVGEPDPEGDVESRNGLGPSLHLAGSRL